MSACVCICTYRLLWSNKHIIAKAHPPKDIMKVFSKSSYLMPTPGVHFCIWRRWQRKANLTLESDGEWVVFFLNHCNCAYQPYLSFDFTSPSHSWLVFWIHSHETSTWEPPKELGIKTLPSEVPVQVASNPQLTPLLNICKWPPLEGARFTVLVHNVMGKELLNMEFFSVSPGFDELEHRPLFPHF